MDKSQRVGLIVVAVCLMLAAVVMMIPKDRSAEVRDGIGRDGSTQSEAPVLNAKSAERAEEKVSGLLRLRTASGTLASGEKWEFQAARPAKDKLTVRDADGRQTTYQPHASGGAGDTLIISTAGRATPAEAQRLARQILVDSKLEIVPVRGRGTGEAYHALKSSQLVAGPVQLDASQVVISGLFPRSQCPQVQTARQTTQLALKLSCTLSVAPENGVRVPKVKKTPPGDY